MSELAPEYLVKTTEAEDLANTQAQENKLLARRGKISWHIKDLLTRDVHAVQQVADWLEAKVTDGKGNKKPRLRSHRTGSKLMARYIAAKTLLAVAESGNAAFLGHVLERTEGKVPNAPTDQGPQVLVQFNFGLQQPREIGAGSASSVIMYSPTAQLQPANLDPDSEKP
jgi:hypothetical protein